MESDPELEFIEREKDSGIMSNNENTPERKIDDPKLELKEITNVENYDDEPDETLAERLWGLTEMFPDPVRNLTGAIVDLTGKSVVAVYKFSCSASWIFFTSSMILFAPVIFETERAQMEEIQRSQQKQVLLGPGSAGLPGGPGGSPNLPPMPR